jgi:hypothetical protein
MKAPMTDMNHSKTGSTTLRHNPDVPNAKLAVLVMNHAQGQTISFMHFVPRTHNKMSIFTAGTETVVKFTHRWLKQRNSLCSMSACKGRGGRVIK